MKILMNIVIFLLVIRYSHAAEEANYEGYKVLSIAVDTEFQRDALNQLQEGKPGFGFWTRASFGRPGNIMISPAYSTFTDHLDNGMFQYNISIQDVQQLVDKSQVLHKTNIGFMDWRNYHNLKTIYNWMNLMDAKHQDLLTVITIGTSSEGRDIKLMRISPHREEAKPAIWIDAGFHGHEWISQAVALWIVNGLLTSEEAAIRKVVDNYIWYILPVANPDGYDYSCTVDRLWRKTSSDDGYSNCVGVDMDRNWDVQWSGRGSSNNSCNEVYAGRKPFSELETQAISKFLKSIKGHLQYYISLHAYGQMLLYPYAMSDEEISEKQFYVAACERAIEELAKRHGTSYACSSAGYMESIITGTSMDWVYQNLNVRLAFMYELRDKGATGFLLPSKQIIPTAEETFDSILAIIDYAEKKPRKMGSDKSAKDASAASTAKCYFALWPLLFGFVFNFHYTWKVNKF